MSCMSSEDPSATALRLSYAAHRGPAASLELNTANGAGVR
jgi:hypothetical protein